MTITKCRMSEIPPPAPEERARLEALARIPDEEIDFSDNPEWTEEDWACATMASDYPSREEALAEASRLADMRDAGMAMEEIKAYKKSRIGRLATV